MGKKKQGTDNGNTILIESCIAGNDEIMDKILPKSDINAQNDKPRTALHEAIYSGSLKCVQKLLNTGKCDLNMHGQCSEGILKIDVLN